MSFDQLPKNLNGKIDRRRLKELFEDQMKGFEPGGQRPVSAPLAT
jgi:acyl-coenzyme A synthetase/AMP-(fatty) acid ligase